MEFNEILNMLGNTLDEASLAQVTKRINRHRSTAKSPSELARNIAYDNALKTSLSAVQSASDAEKKEYATLIADPNVAGALKLLPTDMKSGIAQLSKLGSGENGQAAPQAAPAQPTPGPVSTMSKEDQATIQQIQNDFVKVKTPADKEALIKKWTADTYKAKMYKLALKTGIIK